MTIGFPSRVAVRCSVACVAGALALAPTSAVAEDGANQEAPLVSAPNSAGSRSSTLDRPGTQVRPRAGAPTVPQHVSARSWLVADAVTGEVLAARDAHLRLPPASTLKTLFALTVLPALPAAVRHTVTQKDLAGVGPGSSLVGSRRGAHLQLVRPVARRLSELGQRRRPRTGRDERRLAQHGRPDAGQGPVALGLATRGSSRPTATTRPARCRPRTTWPSSGGPGCATRTSRGTPPPPCEVPGRRLGVRHPEHQPAADRRQRGQAL